MFGFFFAAESVISLEKTVRTSSFLSPKSTRFLVVCLMCLCFSSLSSMRSDLAVALVCILNRTAIVHQRENVTGWTTNDGDCHLTTVDRHEYSGTLLWTPSQVSLLFSSMHWGGLFTGFLSGWLADRYGPKNLLLLSVAVNSVGSFLTPWVVVRIGFPGLFVVRFVMGVGQGVIVPSMGSLMSRWFTPSERSTVIAIYTMGNQFGSMFANSAGAFLCNSHIFVFGGWPAIFHIFGILGVVWMALWMKIVSNSPEKNRYISSHELLYLREQLASESLQYRKLATNSVPWISIMSSGPVLAQLAMTTACACLMAVHEAYLPMYFMQVFFMNIKENGLLSALPYLVLIVIKFAVATLADCLKRRNQQISHTVLCKTFNSIGAFGVAASLIAITFVECTDVKMAVFLTCATFACAANFASGHMTSLVSIAPVYTGIVSGFSRFFGQIGLICGSVVVGFVVKEGTGEEWRTVQLLIAAVFITGGCVYLVLGSADIQPWAKLISATELPLDETNTVPFVTHSNST